MASSDTCANQMMQKSWQRKCNNGKGEKLKAMKFKILLQKNIVELNNCNVKN